MTKETLVPSTDFLNWLMVKQVLFETERVGTDGSLYEKNTLEHGLKRGVIGEAQEALEELRELITTEILTPDQTELIAELRRKLQLEIIDIAIFLGSVFVHAGLTPDSIVELIALKMQKNSEKYATENFRGRTVAEGIAYSRQLHRERTDAISPRQGVSIPITHSSGSVPGEAEEYSLSGAGSLT